MTVVYSYYELGPYAMGPVEFFLSYDEIRDLLGPGAWTTWVWPRGREGKQEEGDAARPSPSSCFPKIESISGSEMERQQQKIQNFNL